MFRRWAPITVVLLLLGAAACAARGDEAAELAKYDERVLKDAGLGTNGTDALVFLRKRTLSPEDLRTIPKLIRQLGDGDFDKREEASKRLLEFGPPVLPLIRPATSDADAEVSRRAREVIAEIEGGPGAALPMAAARHVARTKPAGAVPVLVNYLPFADDAGVIGEVMDALVALTPDVDKADAVLRAALKDPLALKRAAGAFVLGRAKDDELRGEVRKLLADKDATVRFRAALGLLAGRDKAAVPTMIELATAAHGDLTWQAEDTLVRLAEGYPLGLLNRDTDEARKTNRKVWTAWWDANAAKVDLKKLEDAPRHLGYTLIPEMHANKVWEIGPDKKVLWEARVDGCPIDAQILPGGRFLVAELNTHQVTERDQKTGNVLWMYKINTPIACARLPNGHTFIGTNGSLHVVTPDGKDVMTYKATDGFFIHSVQRLRNGNMVCVSMEGSVREIDATGKEVRTVPLPIRGSWSGVEGVPNGNYLAVNNAEGKIVEVDKAGKVVWEYQTPGACYASRLPSGNTLIVSNQSGITEVTPTKEKVWEQPIGSSLWRAHRR
jgi:outer membrane protein assembly factor BamB